MFPKNIITVLKQLQSTKKILYPYSSSMPLTALSECVKQSKAEYRKVVLLYFFFNMTKHKMEQQYKNTPADKCM